MSGFTVVVAMTPEGGIGRAGSIPWDIPEDMAHFRKITTGMPAGQENAIIMGRKTWDSLPRRPLARRKNIVISRAGCDADGATVVPSFDAALAAAADSREVFVIGGAQVYEIALAHPRCMRAIVSVVHPDADTQCDAHVKIPAGFRVISSTGRMATKGGGLEIVIMER